MYTKIACIELSEMESYRVRIACNIVGVVQGILSICPLVAAFLATTHTLSAISSQENTVQHGKIQYRICFHSYRLQLCAILTIADAWKLLFYNLGLNSKIIVSTET